ncbi:hypothetical protein [Actinomyces mediterranea]|uniref:hypothetical protein n=1 Tax=Actinomyces mediterranea TaxID=1871028 RepID=UPI0009710F70|nr:hypothetical protein [Actinomyces mediterranea]
MTTRRTIRRPLVAIAASSVAMIALAACTTGVHAPSASADAPTAHSHDETSPRLVFTYDGGIKVLDATTLDEIADLPLSGFNRLNAYGDGEHIAVSTEGGFRILSSGARGGDPRLTDLMIAAQKPGHVVVHARHTVFFDDGTGLIQALPTDGLGGTADSTVTELPQIRAIESEAPHHGVAVVLENGSVVRTVGTAQARTGALVDDDAGTRIARSDECPGVHGEGVAQNEIVTIGCENGVLIWDGDEFTKIGSPDADYGRIGNEFATPDSSIVVTDYKNDKHAEGVTLDKIGFVDTEAKTLNVIDMPAGVHYTWRGLKRDGAGNAWVLGTDGRLYPIDVAAQSIGDPIDVTAAWEGPGKWQDPHPSLTVDGSTAWVTEPATEQVHRVDLAERTVSTTTVGAAPNETALATGEAHHHTH